MPVEDEEDDVNATIPSSGASLIQVTATATLTRLIQDNKKAGARDRVEADIYDQGGKT